MQQNQKFLYQCINCGAEYADNELIYLCYACSKQNKPGEPPKGVLKVIYDYQAVKNKNLDFQNLKENKFLDLLPIEKKESLPNLRIGDTPLYTFTSFGNDKLPFKLHLKDDSQNPTFSFKDRASALVSAFAKERGFDTIVTASTGNAGSSLAGICAAQGQKAIIMVPESAPPAKLTQIMMYGASIVPVKGTYDDAFDLSIAATERFGWYNRNTAYNPLTIEGKKTVAFELFEQLGFRIPNRIFVPVGDGVIISGVYKGFEDLIMLGFINRMPIIVAVQSMGSDNLVRNLDKPVFEIKSSHTIADSIAVDIPRNFFMTQQFLRQYRGETIVVSDMEILTASSVLASKTGIFAEPAASAAFAGLMAYQQQEKLPAISDNVVLLTGSGLKDLKSVSSMVIMPPSKFPDVRNI
ncbi:MAG: threonine synthase [Bacteroidales bacterium]|nr:threonine synthase [Bacteroidales bacterium]MDZ4203861.1 threonine synthase [Bacteroidales bacterium]